jgi:single-strand DNA-binding protein
MFNATTVTIAGNVVDAPQLHKAGGSATPVTTFRVVTTSRRYDKGLRQWVDSDTMFFRVSCWRQLAENAAVSLGKGDPVIVHGRLVQREYDLDGRRHRSVDIDAYVIGPDLARATVVFTEEMSGPGAMATELAVGQAPAPEAAPVVAPEAAREAGAEERAADGAVDHAAEPAMAPV